jgi:hypothetical protein
MCNSLQCDYRRSAMSPFITRTCRTRSILLMTAVALQAGVARAEEGQDTFGECQLRQLLKDRPAMRGIVDADDFVYQWVVRQFDSRRQFGRIHWDPREPKSGRPAEHQIAYLASPAYIRLSSAKTISGCDSWLALVFELHNIQNSKSFEELYKEAIAGRIDRKQYSDECLALEFKALVQTQTFFRRHPIPGATALKDPNYTAYLNGSSSLDDYKRMLDSDDPNAYDPRDYFGESFDRYHSGTIKAWAMWLSDLQSE